MLWYVKTKRAQTNMDDEGWQESGVTPTLNAFDMGDTRATVIVFHPHRSDGARIQGDTINTLTAFMGTGGLNTPMVSKTYPIQGTIIGRADTSGPQGPGFGQDGDPMYTIDTVSGHGVGMEFNVRRLTPIECERLQGFPDNWTEQRYDYKKNKIVEQADSSRYKQMGNAVAVPVVDWIIGRLVEADANDRQA
jgi:DNA (cytosine-5)-methyltransferase 1